MPGDDPQPRAAASPAGVPLLMLGGLAVLATSVLHGVVGGGQLLDELASGGIGPDLRGAVALGWAAGSLCWALLGIMVMWAGLRERRGDASLRGPAMIVGTMWLGFGVVAMALRGLKPHFLVFVVMGGVVLAGALLLGRVSRTHPR